MMLNAMLDFLIFQDLLSAKYLLSHLHLPRSLRSHFSYTCCTVDDPTSKTPPIIPDGYDLSRAHTSDWLIKFYSHTLFTPLATDNF